MHLLCVYIAIVAYYDDDDGCFDRERIQVFGQTGFRTYSIDQKDHRPDTKHYSNAE